MLKQVLRNLFYCLPYTEMAYPTVATSGINFDLNPATSDNYDLGLKSQNRFGSFTAAIFQSETQDDIVSGESNNGRNTFRNADKTLRQGVELSWNKKLWRDLTAQASYSFIDATFDSDIPNTDPAKVVVKGNYIPGVAKNQAFAALAWQPETGLNAGVDVRYIDKLYVDDINSDAAPSYTLTSANVGYVWKNADWKVRTFARVDNLFDEDYVGSVIVNDSTKPQGHFFEPADDVNWSAGLSVTKAF